MRLTSMWSQKHDRPGGGTALADARPSDGHRPFSRIMVPLDGSAAAEGAIPVALRIARASEGDVDLVWVRSQNGRRTDAQPDRAPIRLSYLECMAEEVGDRLGAPASRHVLVGPTTETLRAHALARGADLVVMGSRGAHGRWRFGLGSTARELVQRLPAPVIVIRSEDEGEIALDREPRLQRIVVALDGSADAEAALAAACELARLLGGTLTLLRILAYPIVSAAVFGEHAAGVSPEGAALEMRNAHADLDRVAARIRAAGVSVGTAVREAESAGAGILRYAREADADLVAITTKGRGASARLLFGGTATLLLHRASTPLLVCG